MQKTDKFFQDMLSKVGLVRIRYRTAVGFINADATWWVPLAKARKACADGEADLLDRVLLGWTFPLPPDIEAALEAGTLSIIKVKDMHGEYELLKGEFWRGHMLIRFW